MKFAIAALLSFAAVVHPASAQEAQAGPTQNTQENAAATQAALDAAARWLALTDEGKFAESWSQAAGPVRAAVTQAQWEGLVRDARAAFGALKSRKLARSHYTRKLPGAPDGEYVVIQYQSEFAGKSGIETVVPMREADGSWKVSGYVIR